MGVLQSAIQAVFGKEATPAPIAAPVPIATPPIVGPDGKTVIPASPGPATPPAPLESYAKLWETAPVPPPNPNAPKGFLESISADNIKKAAGQVDFSRVINDDLLGKINKGGAEGVQALVAALNLTAQEVYSNSAIASTEILKRALAESNENLTKNLPDLVRRTSITGAASRTDKLFANPALQPIISALEVQFSQKYPEASADDVGKMVKEYFGHVGQIFAPQTQPKPGDARRGRDDIDWEEFAGS